jgi:hypothetical protein
MQEQTPNSNAVEPLTDLRQINSGSWTAANLEVTGSAGQNPRFVASLGSGFLNVLTAAGVTRSFAVDTNWQRPLRIQAVLSSSTVPNIEVGY